MKTKTYHVMNLGCFAPVGLADAEGYVTYHDSPRYAKASEAKLREWEGSRVAAVRAAAVTEIAERDLQRWRND